MPAPSCMTEEYHRTPSHRPLPPPPMFHSMPIAMPHRLSSDPTSAHLSFNQSQGLLPPVDLGCGEPCPISSVSAPIQVGISSVSGPITLPSESVSALKLTADYTKEIFSLTCEGHQLKKQVDEKIRQALKSRGSLSHSGSVYQL